MNTNSIQWLLKSVSREREPFVQIRRLDDNYLPQKVTKENLTEITRTDQEKDVEDELCFCFLCEKVVLRRLIKTEAFEIDFLQRYFPTDKELCTSTLYCSTCHDSVGKLKELCSSIAKLNNDLEKLVCAIRMIIKLKRGEQQVKRIVCLDS